MPNQYRRLIFWTFLADLVFYECEYLALNGLEAFLESWSGLKGIALGISGILFFQLFALGAYFALYYFYRKSIQKTIFWISLNILAIISFRYCLEEVIFPATMGFDNFNDQISSLNYFFINFYFALVFTAIGAVFYLIQYSNFKEQQSQALETEHKKIELAFLRAQVNPHFLFNTLNNIYALVYRKSDQALTAMNQLTKLLRYALYEQQEKVPLATELEYIKAFIRLQSLRYDFPVPLQLKVEKELGQALIPPFSFISFVENAFKHAYLKDPEQPLIIEFKKQADQLFFRTKNTKSIQEKEQNNGIGLENIRKRLHLLYQDQQQLKVIEDEHTFEVQVKIPMI
ncbi:MAG: hypothetical protein Sapg2KO_12630 [Saprospiraceae bacterium]